MVVIGGSLSRTMQWLCRNFSFWINGRRAAGVGSFCRGAASARQNEKAPLEGMSEAFGSSAEANDQREAAREEERPQSLEVGYAGWRRVRQTRSRKASHAQMEGRFRTAILMCRADGIWGKKRLHPKMEPY